MKLSNYVNVPPVLLSSENNGNISLFIKGALAYIITYLLLKNGITPDQGDIAGIINALLNIFALIMTLFGLSRKIMNKYSVEE